MADAATSKDRERAVLGRLADRGEEALHKLADLPGSSKAAKAFNELRTRVDEIGKKVRGIDALEARIAKLEKDVAALKRAAKPAAKPKPKAAPRKPAA
jgi:outer membrane murein-binding lipoprotein Lpp